MIENAELWALSQANIRKPTYVAQFAFDKQLDPDIEFLIYDSGMDYDDKKIYVSSSEDVLQQWDQYIYEDFSSRVDSLNWKRQDLRPASVALAQCDITLTNIDKMFSPENTSSDLYPNIRPNRPVRLQAGFSGNNIRQFIGLTQGLPQIDEKARTATFHAVDFLTVVLNTPLRESIMLIDYKIDEIIEYVLQSFGLSPAQYSLEPSNVEIPFFYAAKNDRFLEAAKDLVVAESGSLFMDEFGMIRFLNRGSYEDDVKAEFSTLNSIYDYTRRRETDLINKIRIRSTVRKVQPNGLIFESTEALKINSAGITEIWVNLTDPIISVESPDYDQIGSYMIANTAQDGSGDYSQGVGVVGMDVFATAVKFRFNNISGQTLYITNLVLFGEAAREQDPIIVEMELANSIEQFDEQLYEYESEYIGSKLSAENIGSLLLSEYGNYAGTARIVVRATPQVQLGDVLELDYYGDTFLVRIVQIENSIDKSNGFMQTLHVKDMVDSPFFFYDSDYNYDDGNIYNL